MESGLISRTEVLKFIEKIKCDSEIPKNYGTLLDIMRYIRKLPVVHEVEKVVDDDLESNVIVTARYTHEVDEFNYSKLICGFTDGTEKIFHFCADNPMPKEYVIQGLTWEQLQGVGIGMFRMALGEFIKVNK